MKKQSKKIVYFGAGPKTMTGIMISCLWPFFLPFFSFMDDDLIFSLIFTTVMAVVSSIFIFVLTCLTSLFSLIFRKIVLNYEDLTISVNKEFSFRRKKFQKTVSIDLFEVFKVEIIPEVLMETWRSDRGALFVAHFYLYNDTQEKIILGFMSRKNMNDLVLRIHKINPNIYIIGLGYCFKAVQK